MLQFLIQLYSIQWRQVKIKPHYRSEGPRQGSCAIFGGVLVLSRALYTTMEYLVAELVINFNNMSPHYR